MRKKDKSKQVNKENTSLVRINTDLKDLLKVKAARDKTSMKALLEQGLAEVLEVK